jgi:hypothetical protein
VRLLCPLIPALNSCYAIATEPISPQILLEEYGETCENQSNLEGLYRLKESERTLAIIGNALSTIWGFAESKELKLREIGNNDQCPFEVLIDSMVALRRAIVKFNSLSDQNGSPNVNLGGIKRRASAEMKQVIGQVRNVIDKLMQASKQDFWAQWPTPTQAEVEAVVARKLGVTPGTSRPCDICNWL